MPGGGRNYTCLSHISAHQWWRCCTKKTLRGGGEGGEKGGGQGTAAPPLWPPMNVHETNVFNLTGRYKITKLVGGGENVTTKPYHSFMCTEFSKWGEKTRMTPPPHHGQGRGRNYTCPSPMCTVTPMIMNYLLCFERLLLNHSRNMPSIDKLCN